MTSINGDMEIRALQVHLFLEYMKERGRSSVLVRAMEEEYAMLRMKHDTKLLKLLQATMKELLRETFSPSQRAELGARFTEAGVASEDLDGHVKVRRILAKEEVSSPAQYEMLLAFVDEMSQTAGDPLLIEHANRLLRSYELTQRKKVKRSGTS